MEDMSEVRKDPVMQNFVELQKSMRTAVMLPHDEVDRIVVNRLIEMRNNPANHKEDMSHFDKVLLSFLTEDEFEEYVIEGHGIEY